MDESSQSGRKLILGLGNPGPQYEETRHNYGFKVVEEIAKRWGLSFDQESCRSRFARGSRADLAAPLTFMNRSGYAARCLVEQENYSSADVLVVFDDVALPLGTLRLRKNGGPGGHRGMESIIENLRTDDVPRLRLGIAPTLAEDESPPDLVEFVLSPFADSELERVQTEVGRAADACEAWLEHGADWAMCHFNG